MDYRRGRRARSGNDEALADAQRIAVLDVVDRGERFDARIVASGKGGEGISWGNDVVGLEHPDLGCDRPGSRSRARGGLGRANRGRGSAVRRAESSHALSLSADPEPPADHADDHYAADHKEGRQHHAMSVSESGHRCGCRWRWLGSTGDRKLVGRAWSPWLAT